MRFQYSIVLLSVLIGFSFSAETLPEFTQTAEVGNSRELDWLVEGGNQNLYLVNFYMPGDDHELVKQDLQRKIAGNAKYKDRVTYIEVNAARTYQYKEILQEVGIYNEPSRMYPYILLIQGGEGYVFRGGNIGDLVSRKIQNVIDGRVDFDSTK